MDSTIPSALASSNDVPVLLLNQAKKSFFSKVISQWANGKETIGVLASKTSDISNVRGGYRVLISTGLAFKFKTSVFLSLAKKLHQMTEIIRLN